MKTLVMSLLSPPAQSHVFICFVFYWYFDLSKVDKYSPCSCWHSVCKPTLQVCMFMSPGAPWGTGSPPSASVLLWPCPHSGDAWHCYTGPVPVSARALLTSSVPEHILCPRTHIDIRCLFSLWVTCATKNQQSLIRLVLLRLQCA